MTPHRRRLLPLFAGVALLAAPASAAVEQTPATPMGDVEYRALLVAAQAAAEAGRCAVLSGLVDPALPRLNGRDRMAVQLLRVPCLAATGQNGELAAAYRELVVAEPKNGMIRSVGVVVAIAGSDYVEAANRLASLADDEPAALGPMNGIVARAIIQGLTERHAFAARDRVLIALAQADWQPRDRPEMRVGFAQGAIEALLTADRVDEARALLPRVDAPELLAGMATARHYGPLWPAIEARLGAHAAAAIDRFATARLDTFANRPDDDAARRDAARALLLLGRYAEVGEVAAPVQVVAGMSEADVSVVRYDSQALVALGRPTEALARLRPFATLDLARTPSAASALVGLVELLDENGREEEALTVAGAALAAGDGTAFSPWGRGWLKRTQACALGALGRKAEADVIGEALKRDEPGNAAATIEALLCLRRDREAAALAIATLATNEGAQLLVDQFQPRGALWAAGPSRLRELWGALLKRGDVRAAFDKAARILPDRLWPTRDPRPIPHKARPDDVPVA